MDDQTIMVEYALTDSFLCALVIAPRQVNIYKTDLDSAFYSSLHEFLRLVQHRTSRGKRDFLKSSHFLYQKLIQPLDLDSVERVVIIPDGKLSSVPFEVLVSRFEPESGWHEQPFWIKRKIITYHYSATLFADQHKNQIELQDKRFVGFAPLFRDKATSKIAFRSIASADSMAVLDALRSIDSTRKRFVPLPETEKEITALEEMLKSSGFKTSIYMGDEATENKLKTLSNAQILHIATHGFYNEKYPRFSGLALSQKADSSDEDGILYAGEIHNLEIKCDLVVLSSCEGGIGKIVKGEGMIALGRGFLYSGVNNIIYSLWKVDDLMTRQLMQAFYRNMLDHHSISGSLALAKRMLLQDPMTAIPAFWSSFVLVGR